ncbi:hypothetical protein CR152_29150 [Massilia violaceinigra]|uniref:Ice-binding protein C-terminal domain-containing protein n=1 Tax=Massilia violaceinigra TaxID=2045208 RepID=A0A2D2DT17_9BURK|nr:PEP-CTERM sorting domain-containing protein [Massilia violaceinigra]ATQ78125.1 hypothetical protein CR152_29150 [Massilia violaceinigra]
MHSRTRHIAVTAIAFAALFAPQLAHADTVHIETSGLTFDTFQSPYAETLVSDVNGAATFSLVNAAHFMGNPNMLNYHTVHGSVFQLSARAGHKVTGYSVTGGFWGELHVGQSPDGSGFPGSAETRSGAWAYAHDVVGGDNFALGEHTTSNLQGHSDFRFDSGPLNKTQPFYLTFEGYIEGYAAPAIWYGNEPGQMWPYRDYSRADVRLKGPLLLTVYTQAVPEPHTYAMTLAGLALLAGVARRRKRAARAGAQA